MPLEFATEAEGVRYQLSQLDQQIRQTLADRLPLLHQLNDLQSYDRSVPNELLSAIFIKACEDPLSGVSPIVLGAVCTRWRRVAWETPPLWSTLGPIPHHRIRQFDVDMLRLYFKNAAQHPIHLHLNLNYLPPRPHATKDFISVIFGENASKIQKLTLSATNSSILLTRIQRAIERSKLCNLSTISFVSRTFTPISLSLTTLCYSADNLHTLMVDWHQLPPIEQISLSRITILKLCNIHIDQCLHVLSQCPRMVEFHCHSARPPEFARSPLVRSQKELPNLEVFDVDFDGPKRNAELAYNAHISSLFTHFRFPNLKRMVWGTLPVTPRPQFTSFLGAMKSLITFECTSYYHEGDLIRLFQYLSPSVKKVYLPSLHHTSVGYLPLLKRITDTIVPSLEPESMRTVELVFPDCVHGIVTMDLRTVKEEFRKVGVHLKISRFSD